MQCDTGIVKRFFILAAILLLSLTPSFSRTTGAELETCLGHNVYFGLYHSEALVLRHDAGRCFRVEAGFQTVSFGKRSLDIRPVFFHDFRFGRAVLEAVVSYGTLSGSRTLCAGAGAGLEMPRWWFFLGYYHRTVSARGYPDRITEPVNTAYEIGVSLLPRSRRWDALLRISNRTMFDIERIYQPTFTAEALWHSDRRISLRLGAGYKPAGMFHLSHNHYQSFVKFGISYKW